MISAVAAMFVLSASGAEFRLIAPDAKQVQWVGDRFGWGAPQPMRRDGDAWVFRIDVPRDARLEYKFVVDGDWRLDVANPAQVDNGVGGFNSVWTGPDYKRTAPLQVPASPLRRVEFDLGGEGVDERRCVLFVPAGRGPFPVILYADGAEYESRLKAPVILANLIAARRVRPAILLLVPPRDRTQEYWRDSMAYEAWVTGPLLARARMAAPVSRRPEDVFVGGASLGGLISMRLAQNHPDVVGGGVHSQSGAFWASPDLLAQSSLRRLAGGARLVLDWGGFEGRLTVSNERLADALGRGGRESTTLVTPEGHNWTAWQNRFAAGLEALLGPPSR